MPNIALLIPIILFIATCAIRVMIIFVHGGMILNGAMMMEALLVQSTSSGEEKFAEIVRLIAVISCDFFIFAYSILPIATCQLRGIYSDFQAPLGTTLGAVYYLGEMASDSMPFWSIFSLMEAGMIWFEYVDLENGGMAMLLCTVNWGLTSMEALMWKRLKRKWKREWRIRDWEEDIEKFRLWYQKFKKNKQRRAEENKDIDDNQTGDQL